MKLPRLFLLLLFVPLLALGGMKPMGFNGKANASATTPSGFGGEITATRLSETTSAGTSVQAVNRTCNVGETICVFVYCLNGTEDVSGIADAAGNTYTSQTTTFLTANGDRMRCFVAPVTTQLTSGSNITITWSGATFSFRGALYCYITNSTAVDSSTAAAMPFGTSCASATLTTTAANTAVVTWLLADATTTTYSGGTFTAIGAAIDFGPSGSRNNYFVQSTFSSNGAKSPGGNWSANCSGNFIEIAFK